MKKLSELNVEKVLDEMITEIKRGSRLLSYQSFIENLSKSEEKKGN